MILLKRGFSCPIKIFKFIATLCLWNSSYETPWLYIIAGVSFLYNSIALYRTTRIACIPAVIIPCLMLVIINFTSGHGSLPSLIGSLYTGILMIFYIIMFLLALRDTKEDLSVLVKDKSLSNETAERYHTELQKNPLLFRLSHFKETSEKENAL